ncbi:MAG TPA: hypothetical protein EYG92_07640 [Lutibacter sp.]|nr:hypothetical protein [Lutibacter sp.]
MQEKVTHIILSYLFLIVFQLPAWIQLEHLTHEHEIHHEFCEGHDLENHIHLSFDDSCLHMHTPVNPILQLVSFNDQEPHISYFINKPNVLVVSTLKQQIRYVSLRAPPKDTSV